MKIIGRERGAGTLKFPDHIYAEYQGIRHDFTCGRKFFGKTMAADSIEVRFDPVSGSAALWTSSPRGLSIRDDYWGVSSNNLQECEGAHVVLTMFHER